MESIIAIERKCKSCGKPLIGRRDKIFCDDFCRNEVKNKERSKTYFHPFVKNVTKTLVKNRSILEKFLETQTSVKSKGSDLIDAGFNFKYFTNVHTTASKDKTYFYCFDYGYLPLDNEWYLIVRFKQ